MRSCRAFAIGTAVAVACLTLPSRHAAQSGRGPALVGVAIDAFFPDWDPPGDVDVVDHRRTKIHVAFSKQRGRWTVLEAPPDKLAWAVCFDGRTLAHLNTHRLNSEATPNWLSQAHDPDTGQKAPFVGKRSREFAGWMDGDVFRPLVVSSTGSCRDPEAWKPEPLPPALLTRLLPEMREATAEIYDCDENGKGIPYAYPDSDIREHRSYVSKSGARIVTLFVRLPDAILNRCDMIEGPGWEWHTFAVLPGGKLTHIGHGLQLIDAGDYDGDGRSEVLFQASGYNSGGYLLAYDDFTNSVRYEWSYH